jgi:hypothetical protein
VLSPDFINHRSRASLKNQNVSRYNGHRDHRTNAEARRLLHFAGGRADAGVLDGWPTQARFWLEWGCSLRTDGLPWAEYIRLMPGEARTV